MPDPIELARTGFFREMPHGDPADPSLAEARNATPAPDEERAAAYLDAGHVYIACAGPCEDVFAPGTWIGPPHYRTDGRFLWPGDLSHYVRAYHVRLADDFVDHIRNNGWTVPGEVEMAELAVPRPSSPAKDPGAGTEPPAAASAPPPEPSATASAEPPLSVPSLAAELAGRIAGAVDTLSGGSADRAAIQRSIEEASAAMAKAIGVLGQELRKTFDRTAAEAGVPLSASLDQLRAWGEKPAEARAADVQAFMTALGQQLEHARAPERQAQAAERAARLGNQIRETIAARLREQGLNPGSETGKPTR